MGEVTVGDIFCEREEKIIVLGFENEGKAVFANIATFSKSGYMDEDSVSVGSLYKLKFIKNINDL